MRVINERIPGTRSFRETIVPSLRAGERVEIVGTGLAGHLVRLAEEGEGGQADRVWWVDMGDSSHYQRRLLRVHVRQLRPIEAAP